MVNAEDEPQVDRPLDFVLRTLSNSIPIDLNLGSAIPAVKTVVARNGSKPSPKNARGNSVKTPNPNEIAMEKISIEPKNY